MRKTLFLLFTLTTSLCSNAQVVKYRSFAAAILDSMAQLPKAVWLPTNLLITVDTIYYRIKIYSNEEGEYDVIEKTISKNVFNGHWTNYIAIDKNGKKRELRLFTILNPYQSHISTLIVTKETNGKILFVAYRLRLNEQIRKEEKFPLTLLFNSAAVTFWDEKNEKWGTRFPFFAYNTIIKMGNDSSVAISSQSNSPNYPKGKLVSDLYYWDEKIEKRYAEGAHTNYHLKVTKDSEFFICNIYRNSDGSISAVAFINDKAMMTYMNTEMGYH